MTRHVTLEPVCRVDPEAVLAAHPNGGGNISRRVHVLNGCLRSVFAQGGNEDKADGGLLRRHVDSETGGAGRHRDGSAAHHEGEVGLGAEVCPREEHGVWTGGLCTELDAKARQVLTAAVCVCVHAERYAALFSKGYTSTCAVKHDSLGVVLCGCMHCVFVSMLGLQTLLFCCWWWCCQQQANQTSKQANKQTKQKQASKQARTPVCLHGRVCGGKEEVEQPKGKSRGGRKCVYVYVRVCGGGVCV